jgi:ATP-binding protein involved in chromosome partitioning
MSLGVRQIKQENDRTLSIHWTDGKSQQLDVVMLRRQCPCAACIDEISKKPLIKPDDIAESVRPKRIVSVGRYALAIEFSDGHRTGIYSYETLRKLGPAPATN